MLAFDFMIDGESAEWWLRAYCQYPHINQEAIKIEIERLFIRRYGICQPLIWKDSLTPIAQR